MRNKVSPIFGLKLLDSKSEVLMLSGQTQPASRVMYCFASSVRDQLLSHIRDAKMPKEAWRNMKKLFDASTTTKKLVVDYTPWIKDICDSLASINVTVEEDEMV